MIGFTSASRCPQMKNLKLAEHLEVAVFELRVTLHLCRCSVCRLKGSVGTFGAKSAGSPPISSPWSSRPCLILDLLSAPPGDYAGFPGCGLLRLHSTYRHDLKIYASDEGRVQMTAAAFAKVSAHRTSQSCVCSMGYTVVDVPHVPLLCFRVCWLWKGS